MHNNTYLAHYGVLGMKWGVRRYETADGHLTPAGKKRYGDDSPKHSVKGNLHRAAAANYNLNARTYDKLGNKALADLNRAAAKNSMQKAANADAKKAQKISAKNEAYREKLSKKASKKADKYSSRAKEAKANIKDLKKNGTNSEAYKKWKEREDFERELDYERRNQQTINGQVYTKSYNLSGEKFAHDFFDGVAASATIRDLINENTERASHYTNLAKKWTDSNEALNNMTITDLTSKKEIKNAYKNK